MVQTVATATTEHVGKWAAAHGEPAWLVDRRTAAWERYLQLPPPPKTEEAWKYTDVTKLGWEQLAILANGSRAAASPLTIRWERGTAPDGVLVMDLAEAVRAHPEVVRRYLQAPERPEFSGISGSHYSGAKYVQLQEALWDRGSVIYVPAGVVVTEPIWMHWQCDAHGVAVFPRTLVIVDEGAECTVIDAFTSAARGAPGKALAHAHAELYCASGATLRYISLQQWQARMEHFFHQHATLGRDSTLTSITVSLGGHITKSTIEAALTAPGATSYLFGLSFADGEQHIDHHTVQTHLAPNTTSDLLFKTALKDDASAVYTGLIRMTKAAQKSDAYQANRNLLLSEGARANTVPQLEIEANDVRCTHGATVGTVDEEQCYYLMSRGLTRFDAEQIVARGFFEELLQRFPSDQFRDIVNAVIDTKLARRGE